MKKNHILVLIIFIITICSCITSCGNNKEKPTVNISIWTDPSSSDLLNEELNEFAKLHAKEANFVFQVSVEGEDTCKSTVLANPENAADIFSFADDQLDELKNSNCLLEITQNTDQIYNSVGGSDSGAAEAITRDEKIYAYPFTAGNGYFLYYNSEYFTEDDVKSLDTILEIAKNNNKKFSMDLSSGWYMYSFFKGAGLDLSMEDNKSICDWNSTSSKYTGVQVAESILNMSRHDGYVSLTDDAFIAGVESGEIIAGINGPWNSGKIEAAWGDKYAATMLPSYKIGNDSIQMYNFMGYKLIGINAYTKEKEWCMTLAEFLTNKDNQIKRFELTGECPSNIEAASDESIQSTPAIAALGKQSQYSSRQSVAETFWEASHKFGIILAAKNSDNKDLQELLDTLVEETTGQ